MMITKPLELKVALLGYVSVGKSTVLNALFQDRYAEVSMRRTTAGINFFRISSTSSRAKRASDAKEDSSRKSRRSEEPNEMNWSTDTEVRSPVSTLQEITADNAVLRETSAIQEKWFDVQLVKPLCDMRDDTRLVLVDIPGVNEAGSNKVYMDYATEKWDSFDCVIVVLDAKQGANTEEQVNLLKRVKQNLIKKHVPVIVLCNKVDDPDDAEMNVLVDEIRGEVERIFQVDCRKRALKAALDACKGDRSVRDWMSPAVIPISAGHAFLYRTACRFDLQDFKKLDGDMIAQIGRDEVGRMRWKKLSQEKKYEAAYAAVSDDSHYKERLEATQFDKFLDILALYCGGEEEQRRMIQRQVQVCVENHFSWKRQMTDDLLSIYERCKAIDMSADTLRDGFWNEFAKLRKHASRLFSEEMNTTALVDAMDQLQQYYVRFVMPLYEDNSEIIRFERQKVAAAMEELIENQFNVVREKEATWDVTQCSISIATELQNYCQSNYHALYSDQYIVGQDEIPESPFNWLKKHNRWENKITKEVVQSAKNPGLLKEVTWKHLSPHDWFTIIRSLLLVSYSKHFCERFGQDIVRLEEIALSGHTAKMLNGNHNLGCKHSINENSSSACSNCTSTAWKSLQYLQGSYKDGVFIPKDETKYSFARQLEMPKKLSDPNHWGHIAWKYCEFMESA